MLSNSRFFSQILLPSLAAVLLFLTAIYFFVLPNYRESLMDGKRETIRELTNTAWSVMHKLNLMVNEDFDIQKAQDEAVIIIRDMRYGPELKDYFWITDTFPRMVMHPYRPSLNGTDLTNYQDPRGKNFFVDIVKLVNKHGDGYIDYKWQWKDDSLTVVPKLSYVKAFEPWGWIVGTGIYIEDVNKEISRLTNTVVWISVFITIVIAAVIIYLARRNYIAEVERQKAQGLLRETMERYKKLVEASTDGVLMEIGSSIVYSNPYLTNLLGYSQHEFDNHNEELVQTLKEFIHSCENQFKTNGPDNLSELSIEQRIRIKDGPTVDVIVNRSKLEIGGKHGVIYAIKDISKHKDVERELDLSMEKFKSIANLMNIGVFRCTIGRNSHFIEINPKTVDLLGYSSLDELKHIPVQNIFDIQEERKEIIRAINEGVFIKDKLIRLKRSDSTILPALVSLFPVKDNHGKPLYCDGIIIDAHTHLHRSGSLEKSNSSLQFSAGIFLKPIADFALPVPCCDMETTVSTASKIMSSANSNIILIFKDDLSPIGVLTNDDISRRLIAKGIGALEKVSDYMSSPVIAVSDKDMVMDAFNLMLQHRIGNVIVKPSDGKNYKFINYLELNELRKNTPEYLINSIVKSETNYEITQLVSKLPLLIENLIETGTSVNTTGKLISKVSDTVTEKLIQDALNIMGTPPAPFVFLALGSEGRCEQTLATDQDNAIVFRSETFNEDICKDYFTKLGAKVCIPLSNAGYPLCKGGIMAMNSDWCNDFGKWKTKITEWLTTPNPQEVLNTSIFFDFRPIYGDFSIAENLNQLCNSILKEKNLYFYNLAKSIINLKPPQFDSQGTGNYDIKLPILALTSIVRLWSIKYGIEAKNTSERLSYLESVGVFNSSLREEFDQALQLFMFLRIKNQIRQINFNENPSNIINIKHLTDIDRMLLKKSLSAINDHMSRLSIEFRIS